MHTFKWMATVSKGYRGSIALCTVLSLLNICMGWCFVWVCKWAVDIATKETDGNIYLVLLLLPCIMICEIGSSALSTWVSQVRNIKLDNQLKQQVFRHLIDSEWRGIEKYHTGDVVNRIEGDVSSVVSFATDTLPGIFVLLFQLVGSFFMLWYLDSSLALIVVCISPIFLLLARLYMRKLHKITREVRESESKVQCQIQENLQYRSVIKTLEQTASTLERMTSVMSVLVGQVRSRARLSVITRIFLSGGFATGYILTFGWGVLQINAGIIGYGTMVAFLQLSGRVQRPIADLSREIPVFVSCFTSAERLMDLLNLQLEKNEPQPMLPVEGLGIRFTEVSFAYQSEAQQTRSIFEHFSYDFSPKSSVAILGETGVGKTTLIRLLLALIKPDSGKIEIYSGADSQEMSAFHRCYYSYVPQGNTLLSGTIRTNLLMGNSNATDEELAVALHKAAAEFVFELPDKLDTICGEHGGGLSEGQAQRIAIARALLRKAPILLLDEATSALDPETELRVMQNLAIEERLVILVTHRPSAADRCSAILKLT